jgi:hypothetical protein
MPLYLGHVQCDRSAADIHRCIAPASNITFFNTDYDFIPYTEENGLRLFQPIASYIRGLRMSSEFHAKMTRKPRTGSLGKSWREIEWGNPHRPTIHTPWDSTSAFNPAICNGMDYLPALARLEQCPQLHRGILRGAGKALAPHPTPTPYPWRQDVDHGASEAQGSPRLGRSLSLLPRGATRLFNARHS